MLTSASKQSQYRKGEKSGKDRDKKEIKTNLLPGDTSSFCLTVWSFVNFTL